MKTLQRVMFPERGQAYVEVVLVLPLILLLVAGVMFFGRVFHTKIALEQAVASGARAAVETLDPSRGLGQGLAATRAVLRAYGLVSAQVSVRPLAFWTYGTPVRVQVRYRLYIGDIPLLNIFHGEPWITVESQAYLRVEEYKSRWTR